MAQVSGSVLIVVKGSSSLALSSSSLPSWVVFQGLVRLSAAVGQPVPSDPPTWALAWPPPAWRRRCWVLVGVCSGVSSLSSLGRAGQCFSSAPLGHFPLTWCVELRDADCGIILTEGWGASRLWPGHYSPSLSPRPPPSSSSSSSSLLWHSICSHSVTMKTRKLSRVERLWKVSVFNLSGDACDCDLLKCLPCEAFKRSFFLLINAF